MVDCNRAGILLIEIMTKPIMGAGERTPEVARAYVTALRELVDGCEIIQETRHYQEADGSTSKSRPKETAEDYRYFNDPELPPAIVSREWVEEMRDLVNADALDLIIENC